MKLQGGPQKWHHFLYALSSSNINRFSKFFHRQNQEKIRSNTITKDPNTPQVCRYTTLWNVRLLKATIENKTTSATTHFKKLTTGNNVFIVSVIVSKVAQLSHLEFLHQLFNVSTLLLEDAQAGDATDQWRDQWNAATVCPTQWPSPASAGWLSWIVDVDSPSVEGHPK